MTSKKYSSRSLYMMIFQRSLCFAEILPWSSRLRFIIEACDRGVMNRREANSIDSLKRRHETSIWRCYLSNWFRSIREMKRGKEKESWRSSSPVNSTSEWEESTVKKCYVKPKTADKIILSITFKITTAEKVQPKESQ